MIQIHLRIQIALEQRQALGVFLREAIPYYEEPGGIRVRLLSDLNDPTRFIEIVEYATREAYDRDQRRVEHDPLMHSYLSRWRALLAAPPVIETYEEGAGPTSTSSRLPGIAP